MKEWQCGIVIRLTNRMGRLWSVFALKILPSAICVRVRRNEVCSGGTVVKMIIDVVVSKNNQEHHKESRARLENTRFESFVGTQYLVFFGLGKVFRDCWCSTKVGIIREG